MSGVVWYPVVFARIALVEGSLQVPFGNDASAPQCYPCASVGRVAL